MTLSFIPKRAITITENDIEKYINDDFFYIHGRKCNCGCGMVQVFGFDKYGEVRIDIITRDNLRYMWE